MRKKETVDLSMRSWLGSTDRQLIGCESLIGCEPLRDQVDQTDIRRYLSVHFIHSCHSKQNSIRLDAPILIRLLLN